MNRSDLIDFLANRIDRLQSSRDREGYTDYAIVGVILVVAYGLIDPIVAAMTDSLRVTRLLVVLLFTINVYRPLMTVTRCWKFLPAYRRAMEEERSGYRFMSPKSKGAELLSVAYWGAFERLLIAAGNGAALAYYGAVLKIEFFLWVIMIYRAVEGIGSLLGAKWLLAKLGVLMGDSTAARPVDATNMRTSYTGKLFLAFILLGMAAMFYFANRDTIFSLITVDDFKILAQLLLVLVLLKILVAKHWTSFELSTLQSVEDRALLDHLSEQEIRELLDNEYFGEMTSEGGTQQPDHQETKSV